MGSLTPRCRHTCASLLDLATRAAAVRPGFIQVFPMTWCLCFDLLRIFLVLELMRMVLGPVNPKLTRIIRLSSPVPVLIVPVNLIQFRTMVRGSTVEIVFDPGR